MHAEGAGRGCLDIISRVSHFSYFCLSLEDGSIQIEILSQSRLTQNNKPTKS